MNPEPVINVVDSRLCNTLEIMRTNIISNNNNNNNNNNYNSNNSSNSDKTMTDND